MAHPRTITVAVPQALVSTKNWALFRGLISAFLMVQAAIIFTFHGDEELSFWHSPHRQIMAPPPSIKLSTTQNPNHPLKVDDSEPEYHHHVDEHTLQVARAYAQSFRALGKGPLNFFHIPKTAGTAVEEAAAVQQGLAWGSCRFLHKPKRKICPYPQGSEWPRNVGWWHLPSYLFPVVGSNPYQSSDLFAIVRNPYERMISEFYYICTLKIKDWRPDQCDNRTRLYDEDYLNLWLRRKLLVQTQRQESQANTTAAAHLLLVDNSHFTPQTEFLILSHPFQVRVVDHVLRMGEGNYDEQKASLPDQFRRLMQAYGMTTDNQNHMILPFKASIGAVTGADQQRNTSSSHLGVHNLQASTVDMIHQNYANDFELLGYSKREMPPLGK